MSTIAFYRWSLLLPIAVPLALMAFKSPLTEFFMYSLAYGGIPYVLTLTLFARLLIRGNEREYMILSWFAPLLMILVQVTCGFVIGCFTSASGTSNWLQSAWGTAQFMLFLGVYTLLFGYGYVVLTNITLWMLRRARCIH